MKQMIILSAWFMGFASYGASKAERNRIFPSSQYTVLMQRFQSLRSEDNEAQGIAKALVDCIENFSTDEEQWMARNSASLTEALLQDLTKQIEGEFLPYVGARQRKIAAALAHCEVNSYATEDDARVDFVGKGPWEAAREKCKSCKIDERLKPQTLSKLRHLITLRGCASKRSAGLRWSAYNAAIIHATPTPVPSCIDHPYIRALRRVFGFSVPTPEAQRAAREAQARATVHKKALARAAAGLKAIRN